MKRSIQLSRGHLCIHVKQQHPHWTLDQLLDFAERINPKRAFLFVSKVLGKHIPVQPELMQRSYHDLAQMLAPDLPTPITVIGMAETAVCLGAGLYRALAQRDHLSHSHSHSDSQSQNHRQQAVFMTTTRHPAYGIPKLGDFLEEHSHAQDQFFYSSPDPLIHAHIINTRTLILVDDEISTGKTFFNLLHSLEQANLRQVQRIILVSLVNWSDGLLPKTYQGIPIECVALIHGNWQWHPNHLPLTQAMPDVSSTAHGMFECIAPQTWGREPSYLELQPWRELPYINPKDKVLILGSGEFMWLPFLMAERLAKQGLDVQFSATTRSPIMLGHAIQSICAFKDNYGLGMQNYAYNISHQDFDRVFLVIETAQHSVDPHLFQLIQNLEIISYEHQTVDLYRSG